MKAGTLTGRRVLIAREPARARAWAEPLEARGASVAAREVTRMESMVGEARAQRAIDDLATWDWILFTSQNGLTFFERGLRARGAGIEDLEARLGVVGPRTATALRKRGKRADALAEPANAAGLAAALEEHVHDGDRILIVRPERTTPGLVEPLERLGAEVHSVAFYRSRPAPGLEGLALELAGGSFDAAVFGAPSSFLHLFDACSEGAAARLRWIALIAIGPTTASAIREQGCEVAAVAPNPTPEGIAAALEEAFSG